MSRRSNTRTSTTPTTSTVRRGSPIPTTRRSMGSRIRQKRDPIFWNPNHDIDEENIKLVADNTWGYYKSTSLYQMIDNISLYPFVMSEEVYPAGEMYSLTKDQVYNLTPGHMFIIRVRIDQTRCFADPPNNHYVETILKHNPQPSSVGTFRYPNFYYPSRDGKLNWTIPGYYNERMHPFEATIPTPTYFDLLLSGFKVELVELESSKKKNSEFTDVTDEYQVCGHIWQKGLYIFKDFIDTHKRIKLEEDENEQRDIKTKNEIMKKYEGLPPEELEQKLLEEFHPTYNPARRSSSKDIMNGNGGKVIQKIHTSETKFYTSSTELMKRLDKIAEDILNKEEAKASKESDESESEEEVEITHRSKMNHAIESIAPLIDYDGVESDHAFVTLPKVQPKKHSIPSHLGVFIYAYARSHMWNTIFKWTPVLYSDTDSAVILNEYSNILMEEGLMGTRFGQFKCEGEFDEFYFISPKMYLLRNSETEKIKARHKGVRKTDTFLYRGKYIPVGDEDENTLKFFQELNKTDSEHPLKVKSFSLTTIRSKSSWQHRELIKEISKQDSIVKVKEVIVDETPEVFQVQSEEYEDEEEFGGEEEIYEEGVEGRSDEDYSESL